MDIKYSSQPKTKETSVRSLGRDINVSFKDAVELCNHLKGKMLPKAQEILEQVVEKKYAIPYKKFNKGVGHRQGTQNSTIGKYPVKVAKNVQLILNNLEANAEYKGLDTENLKITSILALKGRSVLKRKPKGRWKPWTTQYVHIQAIAEEVN